MNKYIILISLLSLVGRIIAANNKGLTWGLYGHNFPLNIDRVGCGGVCNAYLGDTSCNIKLPILCVSQSSFKRPPYDVLPCSGCAMTKEFYDGWTEGYFVLSPPVLGTSLLSFNNMRNICSSRFGPTFTVASHTMGKYIIGMNNSTFFYNTWPLTSLSGGWSARGYGNLNTTSRFWVFINNQPANCWN